MAGAASPSDRRLPHFVLLWCRYTNILALILEFTIRLRLGADDENAGIDKAGHAKTAYNFAVADEPILYLLY